MNESIKIAISVNDLNIESSGILHMKNVNDNVKIKISDLELILVFKNDLEDKSARVTVIANDDDSNKGAITLWNISAEHAQVSPFKIGSINAKELYVSLDVTYINEQRAIGYIIYTK